MKIEDLADLITKLMKKVVKNDLLVSATPKSIAQLDLRDINVISSPSDIDLGFAVSEALRENRYIFIEEGGYIQIVPTCWQVL